MNKGFYGISKNRTYDTKYHVLVESSSYADSASYANNATNAISSSYPISVAQTTIYSTSPLSTSTPNTGNNIFLGYQAGNGATNATGSNFLGFNTGQNALDAFNSNFFGDGAGDSATNANNSNFFGKEAGVSASSAFQSNFIGIEAGRYATNAYQSNFIGPFAGQSATNASASNFIGYQAGVNATSAFGSNFIGYNSGNGATYAYKSNFFGEQSGLLASNASNSNFIGLQAGYSASNASNSNFIGQQAGTNATNSSSSIFIGPGAGAYADNAAGSNFIGPSAGNDAFYAYNSNFFGEESGNGAVYANNSNYIGKKAGFLATNASNSNFLGNNAGYSATNAFQSIFIGNSAGFQSTNANQSVFFGDQAGINASSASFSTLIGYRVGAVVDGVGVSTNNIVIGTNISLPSRRRDSINIGGIIFGTGSWFGDGVTGQLMNTGSAGGKIGINVVNPQYTFDVSGSGNFTNGLIVTGSVRATSFTGSFSGSVVGYVSNEATSSFVRDTQTGSFALTTQGNTFAGNTNTFSSQIQVSNTNNATGFNSEAAIHTNGGLRVTKDAWVSGSLYVNNLTVYGTQSVQYVTSSQLNISTNLITVNTATPSVRFGGLAVYDSGSNGTTGSLLWDSQKNVWIYNNPSGNLYDGSVLLMGPRSTTLGNEEYITKGYLVVADGSHHTTSSQIYNSESVIRLETDTKVSGGLDFYPLQVYAKNNEIIGIGGGNTGNGDHGIYSLNADQPIAIFESTTNRYHYANSNYKYIDAPYNVHEFTGSLNVSNGITGSFSGSVFGYVSNEATTSFVTNNQTSSFVQNTQTASMTVGTASRVSGGTQNYIPLWSTGTSLSTSQIYQSSNNIGVGTIDPISPMHISSSASPLMTVECSDAALYSNIRFTGTGRKYTIGVANSSETSFGVANDFFIYDDTAGAMRMIIDTGGNVGIGTVSTAAEANLHLGAKSTSEGGQLVLQKATSYTSASHLDNYQNQFRVLRGNDTTSSAVDLAVSHTNGQLILPRYTGSAAFTTTVTSMLGADSFGNIVTSGFSDPIKSIQSAGSSTKAYPVGLYPGNFTAASAAQTNGTLRVNAVHLPTNETITGVRWYQTALQSGATPSNYNGFGLYSLSGTTLNLIASSSNSTTIWTSTVATANSYNTIAFDSQPVLAPGLYYIAFLYSVSVAGTAPTFGQSVAVSNANVLIPGLTTNVRLSASIPTQTTLASSLAMSSLAAATTFMNVSLY